MQSTDIYDLYTVHLPILITHCIIEWIIFFHRMLVLLFISLIAQYIRHCYFRVIFKRLATWIKPLISNVLLIGEMWRCQEYYSKKTIKNNRIQITACIGSGVFHKMIGYTCSMWRGESHQFNGISNFQWICGIKCNEKLKWLLIEIPIEHSIVKKVI